MSNSPAPDFAKWRDETIPVRVLDRAPNGKVRMDANGNPKKRVVGYIWKDILFKRVRKSEHMLRVPLGWAWDEEIVLAAINFGAKYTVIYDAEGDLFYKAPLNAFRTHGTRFDRGHDPQLVLGLGRWHVTPNGMDATPYIQKEMFNGL